MTVTSTKESNVLKIKYSILEKELKQKYNEKNNPLSYDILIQSHLYCEYLCDIKTDLTTMAYKLQLMHKDISRAEKKSKNAPMLRMHIVNIKSLISRGEFSTDTQIAKAASVLTRFENELRQIEAKNKIKTKRKLKTETNQMSDEIDVDTIWKTIENKLDVSKRSFGKRIGFIDDKFKRSIIFRDIAHAYYLAHNGFSKPAMILAGSIVEELLRLYIIHNKIRPKKDSFFEYIKICNTEGLLKTAISKLSDSIRHFRNLVHLDNEKTKRHTISKPTAIGAITLIFTLSNDFITQQ